MVKPSGADYQLAFQNPNSAFREPYLQRAQATRSRLGLPSLISGNFAVVCNLRSGGDAWAVRAFLKDVPGLQQRYNLISTYLEPKTDEHSTIVGFRYVPDGMLVQGLWHPLVVMDWVPGIQLDKGVEEVLAQAGSLKPLIAAWLRLVRELEVLGIAHGDLQHGNILVDGKRLRLVDYDGMYVPTLAGMVANEAGHPNYQHPARASHGFDQKLDRFSALLIYTALCALECDATLWRKHDMRDDALLFRKSDLVNPGASKLFSELQSSVDPIVRFLTTTLLNSLESGLFPLPLTALLASSGTVQGRLHSLSADASGWWRRPQAESQSEVLITSPIEEAVGSGWLRAYIPQQVATVSGQPPTPMGSEANARGSLPSWINNGAGGIANPVAEGLYFVASLRSGKTIHLSTCNSAKRISPRTLIAFATVEDAQAAGFEPCKVCAPERARQPASQLRIQPQSPIAMPSDVSTAPAVPTPSIWNPAKVGAILRTPPASLSSRPGFPNARVEIGSQVKLQYESGDVETVRLVKAGTRRAGTFQIADDTPLGRALRGKYLGDTVKCQQLGRQLSARILEVR